jgi:uncharacterized protein involved in oxidation of intracellular sulfur
LQALGNPVGPQHARRLAPVHALLKHDPAEKVTVFLLGDAVPCAKTGQSTPDGYYNLERMVKRVVLAQGDVLLCGTCMDARGIGAAEVIEGARRSTMAACRSSCGLTPPQRNTVLVRQRGCRWALSTLKSDPRPLGKAAIEQT